MRVMTLRIPRKRGPEMCNLDVLERLAAAWNPPEVEGFVSIADGASPDTFHICVTATSAGRALRVSSPVLQNGLLRNPDYRRTLAREARDFFSGALYSHPEISSRTLTHC